MKNGVSQNRGFPVPDFCIFEFFGVGGSVGLLPGHRTKCLHGEVNTIHSERA